MKKLLVLGLILALVLTLTTVYAEDTAGMADTAGAAGAASAEDAAGGRFDASVCDTETNEDGSVSLLGIPGDPVPVTWGEFEPRFYQSLESNGFTGEFAFPEPLFSDGLWVRVMTLDNILYVRAVTTKPGDDGLVVELSAVSGKEDETLSEYVKYLTACLFEAAARTEGTFGETTLLMMHIDPALDARNFSLDKSYWYQNGFTMYLGVRNDLYAVGRIEYGGEYAKTPVTELVGSPMLEPPIADGKCDVAAFLKRSTPYFDMVFGGVPEQILSSVSEGRRMLAYTVGEQLYLSLCLNGEAETDSIGNMLILDAQGNPPHVFAAGQIALYALSDMPEDTFYACAFINGERSTWDELSELLPCAAYNGVRYCCVNIELSTEEVTPMAVLFGE